MSSARPYVLSIAGFDPSGGAGILADIKTLEALGCYGLGINTANTVQNDHIFKDCYWTEHRIILEQLEVLAERFPINVVKIGVLENLVIMDKVLKKLFSYNPKMKIIWDPVLKTTTGFEFLRIDNKAGILEKVLKSLYIITPNFNEIKSFSAENSVAGGIERIGKNCNLYLKGGHFPEHIGLDKLFLMNGDVLEFYPGKGEFTEKHGSGCVLSSAIAAYTALGRPISEACKKAKSYTENFLASNNSLLGYHQL